MGGGIHRDVRSGRGSLVGWNPTLRFLRVIAWWSGPPHYLLLHANIAQKCIFDIFQSGQLLAAQFVIVAIVPPDHSPRFQLQLP
ncbi:hypothetical protein CX676_17055 [Paracoccus zhejiangensis]|uniref:Uncharacterized protein n=1 Tax=Paracoccus zhejiangensis TaxID=1077935 RepID=A0A2H5F293_9RHOB|nr:hypothetical protein CX676_17055 [Paracoccus zhejiangensis]